MTSSSNDLIEHLLTRLREVQRNFRFEETGDPNVPLAEVLDSMGLVELVAILAEDFGVTPDTIEQAVGRKYGAIAEVARRLQAAGLSQKMQNQSEEIANWGGEKPAREDTSSGHDKKVLGWLASTAVRLPEKTQPASEINEILHRPPGWLESHAGIQQRRIWADQDPLLAACEAAQECLTRAGLSAAEVGALLVTSEAPPLPVGLAAALHHRLQLGSGATALEIGGACTGFLAAWWTGVRLLPSCSNVLILSVEHHSQHLALSPGSAGEAAALFGDAAAACLMNARSISSSSRPIRAIVHQTDGSGVGLLRVELGKTGAYELRMQGVALAGRAVRAMAQSVRELGERHGLKVADLDAVVVHGGNGRLPGLVALQLGIPVERIWSQTSLTGNVGSASLPVAWASQPNLPSGLVAWTAVGAGLTWAAALTGPPK
ncbi:MAG TPA: 3-oxoacyl-[acyl-carrier-protein] synthase III C-terminal domain-containing protein [Gemmataceae bacterium]|jgi:3-oxoacyl-[acyl-carrier-protein] synthase-3|nr:3-oxoacyl-[acyl-carrier-protein] synthase III C-terminal domain-containing protein [Gemmataceae bacterium]